MHHYTLFFFGIESSKIEGTEKLTVNLNYLADQRAGGGAAIFYDSAGNKVGSLTTFSTFNSVSSSGSTKCIYFDVNEVQLGSSVTSFTYEALKMTESATINYYNMNDEYIGCLKYTTFYNIDDKPVGTYQDNTCSFTVTASENFKHTQQQLLAKQKQKEETEQYWKDRQTWIVSKQEEQAQGITFQFNAEKEKKGNQENDFLMEISELKRRSENGNIKANLMMGIYSYYGMKGCKKEFRKCRGFFEEVRKALQYKRDDKFYLFMDGLEALYDHVSKGKMQYFQKAMDEGYVPALFEGAKLIRSTDKGSELLLYCANQGYTPAQVEVGDRYRDRYLSFSRSDNSSTEPDNIKALALEAVKQYQLAADAGDGQARMNLAEFYARGYGVKEDISKAKGLYSLAADQDIEGAADKLQQLNKSDCCVIL